MSPSSTTALIASSNSSTQSQRGVREPDSPEGTLANSAVLCSWRSFSDFFSASRINDMLQSFASSGVVRRGVSSGASNELMMICV